MTLETKNNWVIPKKKKGDILKNLLKKRGFGDVEDFLDTDISRVPSFEKLYGAEVAAKKILEYVNEGKKIVIHGDYDSDGICATALLWSFLYRDLSKHIGKEISVLPYIPDRVDQGYGLTDSSLNDVIDLGANLVISVDCGVRDKELIKRYMKEKDLDFVITDHHQPPEDISKKLTYTLVHQMFPDHEYPQKEICGTTIAFLLIQAIRKEAGMDFTLTEDTTGLDLVAVSTITDMMPLIGVNRILVSNGLKQIHKGKRVGLRALALRSALDIQSITSYHLGYVIGPRINAVGRIGSPMDAVKLLVSNDENLCKEISNNLNSVNFDRQQMTMEVLEYAKQNISDENKIIIIYGEGWHEGIIGLVAGKLQEEYYKPVLVVTNNEGVIKGSARSIKGFNITTALEECGEYLERYGGHELAAGFSVNGNSFEEFSKHLTEYANDSITDQMLIRNIDIDLNLESDDVNGELVNNIKSMEPFGYGNPKPLIYLENLVIVKKTPMGQEKNHLRLTVKGSGIDLLTLVLFNCQEDIKKLAENESIDVVGYPDVNVWNGTENIQLHVKEWRHHI